MSTSREKGRPPPVAPVAAAVAAAAADTAALPETRLTPSKGGWETEPHHTKLKPKEAAIKSVKEAAENFFSKQRPMAGKRTPMGEISNIARVPAQPRAASRPRR